MVLFWILYQSHSVQWYFVDHGQPRGPHSFEELQRFHAIETIQNETLCWREGLPSWQRFDSLANPGPVQTPDPVLEPSPYQPQNPPVSVSTPASDATNFSTSNSILNPDSASQTLASDSSTPFPASHSHICVQCGKSVSEEDMLHYQNLWVCAPCKPAFMKAVSEGLVNRSQLTYAAVISRFGANLIDVSLISIVNVPVGFAIQGINLAAIVNHQQPEPLYQILSMLFGFALSSGYYFIFIAWTKATPGMMFFGLRLVAANGAPVSLLQSLGWTASNIVINLTFSLGVLTAIWDNEKRTIQDMICNTRMIYKRA